MATVERTVTEKVCDVCGEPACPFGIELTLYGPGGTTSWEREVAHEWKPAADLCEEHARDLARIVSGRLVEAGLFDCDSSAWVECREQAAAHDVEAIRKLCAGGEVE